MSVRFLENLSLARKTLPHNILFHLPSVLAKVGTKYVLKGIDHSEIPNYSLSSDRDTYGGWGFSDSELIKILLPMADSGDGEV